MKLFLATCDEKPDGTADDQLLWKQLLRRGISTEFRAWSDVSVHWEQADLVLIRSTWDYHRRLPEFLEWAGRVEKLTQLANPLAVVHWNSTKRYLLELQTQGLPIIPSVFVNELTAAREAVKTTLQELGQAVIKPAVSATAERTFRVSDALIAENAVTQALKRGEIVIQPYISSIANSGEVSLLYFKTKSGCHFSHAVLSTLR